MTRSPEETANAVFKRRARDWYWHSLALAAVVHFTVFAFWPTMSVADMATSSDDTTILTLPPDLVVPPPPEDIVKPARPVPSTMDLGTDHTMPSFDQIWDAPPVELPPAAAPREEERVDWVTALMVAPRLLNAPAVERALQRSYPPVLREAGVGGTVIVHLMIDEDGSVLRREIGEASGYPALDNAALAVAEEMRFTPAINRGRNVKVWVAVPVVFRTR
jgi:periplasmic protein TonB